MKAGDVCYNYVSGCFNDPKRINNPANKCNFPIRAAAYNWSNPTLSAWFLKEVIAPAMVHASKTSPQPRLVFVVGGVLFRCRVAAEHFADCVCVLGLHPRHALRGPAVGVAKLTEPKKGA